MFASFFSALRCTVQYCIALRSIKQRKKNESSFPSSAIFRLTRSVRFVFNLKLPRSRAKYKAEWYSTTWGECMFGIILSAIDLWV